MNERQRIERLLAIFGAQTPRSDAHESASRIAPPISPSVALGIGDDAAVLAVPDTTLVWTVDAQVEHTHFDRAWMSWEDVGYRSFMAAASDLAAMGAEPVAALSALVLAPSVDDEAFATLAGGQQMAAREVGAPVVGGNLARGTETSITTTLLGRARSPVLRSGARPGDLLLLAGPVGLAAAGLTWLGRFGANVQDARISTALAAFRRPAARIADGRRLAEGKASGFVHAALDISDGLACDAERLAEASGVDVVFDAEAVVRHGGDALRDAAVAVRRDALDLALYGGEDYALLVASAQPLEGFSCVGAVEERRSRDGRAGVFLRRAGETYSIEPRGFDHFTS